MNLKDFSAQDQVGKRCQACACPHREEIDEGYREGIPASTIFRWLQSEGADVSENSLRRHLKEHVGR